MLIFILILFYVISIDADALFTLVFAVFGTQLFQHVGREFGTSVVSPFLAVAALEHFFVIVGQAVAAANYCVYVADRGLGGLVCWSIVVGASCTWCTWCFFVA